MNRPSLLNPEFNILFPYELFVWRLEHGTTICHFECEEHLQKYIDRYKLKVKDIKVSNRDGKSLKSSQKHKTNIQQTTRKGNNRSTGSVRKRKSRVDSTRNSTRNTKILSPTYLKK